MMSKTTYATIISSLYLLMSQVALAQDTGNAGGGTGGTVVNNVTNNTTNVGTCDPTITVTIWGALVVVSALVFGIGKFVITPALESKAIQNNPDDPEPHVKSAKLKGMGVTSILTAITLLLVSFLLLGCIPVPMMIFIAVIFLVIFGYGALLM